MMQIIIYYRSLEKKIAKKNLSIYNFNFSHKYLLSFSHYEYYLQNNTNRNHLDVYSQNICTINKKVRITHFALFWLDTFL